MNPPKMFSRLGFRLMLFNCLLVFLPLAALIVLDVFEGGMLEAQENTMAAQARVLAAALGTVQAPPNSLASQWKTAAQGALSALAGQTTTRLRVLDHRAAVVADSSRSGPAASSTAATNSYTRKAPEPPAKTDVFTSLTYQLGSLPFRVWRALSPPEAPTETPDDATLSGNPAVTAALSGRYGAHTRVSSGQRSVTLYSAVPIVSESRALLGVVLASQSTWRTLQALYQIRLTLFQIFLASLVVALGLSFLLSLTISRPLRRMRAMAEGFIDQWGRPTGQFRAVKGSDELASLSRSLVRLGDGLADHVRFIESFASDLAHELRNPLAAIRASAELLAGAPETERARLTTILLTETDRIDRLAALSRDLSRLDIAVGRCLRVRLDARELAFQTAEAWRLRGCQLGLAVADHPDTPWTLIGDQGFLRQAIDKTVENALDYSPEPGTVVLGLEADAAHIWFTVADRGPGVPPDRRDQIFERFHTDRREQGHTGLGLSLARTIVEGFGGQISTADRPGGGAVFVLRFPRA